ncbi:MAG TPA: hypothetical protein VGO63_01590 [Candidatus Paceibacterota bacterium]|jgi:hypothetical protein|nr:hypothetical protein [Candidatus Paceibacterota bacterium]
MKKASFGARCPYCGVGTMTISTLLNDKNEPHLFYISSAGDIWFDCTCSFCGVQFSASFSLMELIAQCPAEEDETAPPRKENLYIFKKRVIL